MKISLLSSFVAAPKTLLSGLLGCLLSLIAITPAKAGIPEGAAAIQEQLPSGVTIASASHEQMLAALKAAARANPDAAIDIAAAAVKERWTVLDGQGTTMSTPSDGKSVRDFKGSPMSEDDKINALKEYADAIIWGATPEGENPNPALVSAVLQAMMFGIPSDMAGLGATLYEGVLGGLPPGVAALVDSQSSGLRTLPVYQYSTPPTTTTGVNEGAALSDQGSGGEGGSRPQPQPVTQVTNQ